MAKILSVSLAFFILVLLCLCRAQAQLVENFYSVTCPKLEKIVTKGMREATKADPRLPASMIRLFFHDCFVNGCDASILLKDTATFTGEQNAGPNKNIRGMDVIEAIKDEIDEACNATVSCADILALATRDGVALSGGPSWTVKLGRRDARTASLSATSSLPSPGSSLATLITIFSSQGFNLRDLVALSGAHTFGMARCATFRNRIYNDSNIDPAFAASRQAGCPSTGGDSNLAPLDVRTQNAFDNAYFVNLAARQGLLHSDQELFNNGSADPIVISYASDKRAFFSDFVAAMVRLGDLSPLTGSSGEIRRVCSRVN